MTWQPDLALAPQSDKPLFLQIAQSIARDIRRGRFEPNTRLPGSRTLARRLLVHRNTVTQAYAELEAQGWVSAQPARGVFVAAEIPRVELESQTGTTGLTQDRVGFVLPPFEPSVQLPMQAHGLKLYGGIPDLTFFPAKALARAYRNALVLGPGKLLNYTGPAGHPKLRAALSSMLRANRGIATSPEQVFVTRGSQMALYLAAKAALPVGATIAVESFGYGPAWAAFRSAGARLVPIPVDAHGLCTHTLSRLLARRRINAVYVTPHHQYPTTVMLSPARRLDLLRLAREHQFAVIEDDYDHEFHYAGRPVLPLASDDHDGVVLYVGTLSKILAPALRTGYLVAPTPVLKRVAELRGRIDRQGDQVLELALATLLEDGEVERHARRAQRRYHERRDVLAGEVTRNLSACLSFTLPPGGMALWAKARGVDVDAWAQRCSQQGVHFVTAQTYAYDRRARPFVRLGFAALRPPQLKRAVQLMAQML